MQWQCDCGTRWSVSGCTARACQDPGVGRVHIVHDCGLCKPLNSLTLAEERVSENRRAQARALADVGEYAEALELAALVPASQVRPPLHGTRAAPAP